MHYKNKQSGFTLIELMVVIVLIAVSVGVTSDILTTLVKGYNKTQVMNELEQNANFITSKIKKELLNARDVSATATQLTVTRSDSTTVVYSVSNNVLYRQVGAGSNLPITRNYPSSPGGVYIEACSPCFTASASTPKRVDIKMSLRQDQAVSGESQVQSSVQIYETIVLRSTYR